jgi:hypothetical protein
MVEVCGFGVGAENIAEHKVRHSALAVLVYDGVEEGGIYCSNYANGNNDQIERLLGCAHNFLSWR